MKSNNKEADTKSENFIICTLQHVELDLVDAFVVIHVAFLVLLAAATPAQIVAVQKIFLLYLSQKLEHIVSPALCTALII